jgi:AraC-like DNA-binding protein
LSHATTEDTSLIRFAVRARPDGDRGGAVRDFYGLSATGRAFLRHGFDPDPDRPLYIDGAMRSLPGLGLVALACSKARTERTRGELHDDDLWLNVTLEGRRAVWHCGREAVFGAGEALLSTGSQASRNAFSDTRFISFRVPFKPIAAMVPNVEDHLCRPIRADVEALRLLARYGAMLMEDTQICSAPAMQRLVTVHVHDLVALALGAGRDAAQVAAARGGQAARLRAIKADIEDNLARPDLSAATIAARHRLPLRYLQRLFEADGVSCTDYVLKRRLARAHQLLRESFDQPISAIAFASGFGHLSRFNRAFRSRFGQTPSDVRLQAQREEWSQTGNGAAARPH